MSENDTAEPVQPSEPDLTPYAFLELDGPAAVPAEVAHEVPQVDLAPSIAAPEPTQTERDAAAIEASLRTFRPAAPEPVPQSLDHTCIIAGVQESATGILLGFRGNGEANRGMLRRVSAECGVPVPPPRSARAQASKAIETLGSGGLIAKANKHKSGLGGRDWDWYVGRADFSGSTGDAFGAVVLTARLGHGENLYVDSTDQGLENRLREEYRRLLDGEIVPAGDVTYWVQTTLRNYHGAVKLGGVWYVPQQHAAAATRFTTALARENWGTDWCHGIPVTTTDRLRDSLAQGLYREAEEVIRDWESKVAAAKPKLPGYRAASGTLERLRDVADRCKSYGEVLGLDRLRSLRTDLVNLADHVAQTVDETSQRGALIWAELRE